MSASFPALDSARLCRDVRAAARSAYVIFQLDDHNEEAMELAFEAGADDVLSMPITEATLRARLNLATRVLDLEEYRNRMHGEGALLAEIAQNTSLHSRRYLEVELGKELDRAFRFAHPVGVCAFDRASTLDLPSPQSLLAGAEAQLLSATREGFGRIARGYPQAH